MDSETQEIIDFFLTESREALAEVEPLIIALEQEGGAPDRKTVDTIFRLFHSMKGSAGFLEFSHVEAVTHHAETLLDQVRTGRLALDGPVVDLMCRALDFSTDALDVIAESHSDGRLAERAGALIQRLESATRGEAVAAPAPATSSAPAVAPSNALEAQLLASGMASAAALAQAISLGEPEREAERERADDGDEAGRRRKAEFLRVDVRKLDQLMDLIGELIIAETAVTHGPDHAVDRAEGASKAAVQLNRITRGLQDVAMSLRMVPIEPTLKKMVRLVRDLSRRQGKRVSLEIQGADTEVDKSVVEAIADPLVHLIRNAIDHGIEAEGDRRAVGKPAEGRLFLIARQQAGEIRILVRDDGKGLSRERILARAIQRGLVAGDGSDLSDAEVYKLIFEPGFSTAEAVTDISGRGVGMDVVKANIESVKGRVEIASTAGQGSTFTLRIPLTLAIIEGMLVRVGETRFTIPMLSILETVSVTGADITRLTNGLEVVRLRGSLLPVFRLHEFYEIPTEVDRIEDGLLVVVEDGHDRMCLLVDELIGQRQTVVKGLSGYLGNVRGLAGCTVLGDGSISLIIDVAKLIQDTRAAA
jgi:two-component system chemotaxis sensor kinase CheA